ncbi:Murein L,D-transpeptidase YcbB/YkuD [Catalinimonas alkaloidigena]|uniref:Murein L,D-transpeptidase YcbB/YkuD n=1 Tax=Catalinimonas alkaloidigena TaxID=1075417 RepID=A0A1G9P0K1_9BACT|nr:L,D-transpeptidase family protein [Catalinimonas alkaloidigena]SDL92338.1 Murein L,D-transpeptidase YcbB/YkuD [Catalinimonas alkaloidigena]
MKHVYCHLVCLGLALGGMESLSAAAPPDSVAQSLMAFIETNGPDERLFSQVVLPDFYRRRQYQPAWTDARNVSDLLAILQAAEQEGLAPAAYHLDRIQRLRCATATAPQCAELDLMLTDATLMYASHLYFGKVDPRTLSASWNVEKRPLPDDPAGTLEASLAICSLPQAFEALKPTHAMYRQLKEKLVVLRQRAALGGWAPVRSEASTPAALGDTVPWLGALRQRLRAEGYAMAADGGTVYDSALAEGVRLYQREHGLVPDGIVGAATLRALNRPVDFWIDQVRVNLERARWVLGHLPDSFLVVNIAAAELYLVYDRQRVWQTSVVVGKTATKTPIFSSHITRVVFNPTWTVPRSILREGLWADIRRNPAYLAQQRMVVQARGQTLDPTTIDWSTYSPSTFPYSVVQRPGPNNALGRVKFYFPNPYHVYLHDTPSKELFARSPRTFSHGCIRVEHPLELARLLLQDSVRWSAAAIDQVVQDGATQQVALSRPLHVLILYWTCDAQPDGRIRFHQDVYRRDPAVLQALNQGEPY